ncbi:PAS domain-containing sensor histidine kinase [Desulfovibrio ferrophilus]|uniref:histidine kinase n=1 Tax=Desulfovibrio ferrophilus TaxID=241368 RepID=A0A2Z6AUZ5_9BACT|nr:PAS domain-containing sensor histidine kinase [Desulfovibrio ferrophilus]BBD07051.1 sensory box protein [Desulfovibrio ferrophilus]
MRFTKRFIFICAISAIAFAAFVAILQQKTLRDAQLQADDHARVIANALWTFEESSALAYLQLAANSYGYEWLIVKDDLGKTFLMIDGPPLSQIDAIFVATGLINRHTITTDIRHDDRTIGTISVLWLSRTIYIHLYVLFCLLLFLGGVWLFMRVLDMNRTLETRVGKRTAELENALSKLGNSEEKYRTLVENIPGAVLHSVNDSHWTALFISDPVEEITGHPARDFMAGEVDYLNQVVHPDDRIRVRATVADALIKGSDYSLEYRIQDASGEQHWVSEKGQGVSWKGGRPEYFTSAIFDITDRKLAEQELLRLQNMLQSTINSMPSVLVGVDTQGRVTQWNLEAERLTGISATSAQHKTLEQVYPALAPEMENVHRAIQEQTVMSTPHLLRQIGGEIRYNDVTVFPLVGIGMQGAVIRVDDVTDRVRIDEVMVQTEKMMSVGGLAAGMAHEINNPLGGILQGAQNIMRRTSPELPANHQAAHDTGCTLDQIRLYMEKRGINRMLSGIQESGLRAAKIVSNMLDFSRKSGTSMATCDVNVLADTVLDLATSDYDLKKSYDFKKVRIIREYSHDLDQITCAHTEIEQVLFNLVKNAAYAMADHPKPGIAPIIIIRTRREGNTAVIEVEDNGPGMTMEIRKRIFEPFFTTKPPGVGTGLGLSVSYFIITQNHGGQFTVESTPGVGTTFIIKLPLTLTS